MREIYIYEAINLKGKTISGEYYQESIDELVKDLRNKGYYLLKFKVKKKKFHNLIIKKIGYKNISIICNELSILLDSGMNIIDALNIIREQSGNIAAKRKINNIIQGLQKGEGLYSNIKKYKGYIPKFLIYCICIGEESGQLPKVLKELSEYYEKQNKINSKMIEALMYPSLVFFVSIIMCGFLFVNILPQFVEILNSLNGKVPFITKIMLFIFKSINSNLDVLVILNVLFFILLLYYFKSHKGRDCLDFMKLKIPLVKKIYIDFLIYKFSYEASILINSGFNIIKALDISTQMTNNRIIEKELKICIAKVKSGEEIYKAFKDCNIFDYTFITMLRVGEETGNLDSMLMNITTLYFNNGYRKLKKLTTLIGPMMIIFMSLIVGLIILSIIPSITNIMDLI